MNKSLPPLQPTSPSVVKSIRTARACLTIFAGHEVLVEGSELARQLWNQARCWQRQHYDEKGYIADWTDLQQALRQENATYGLNDRCFSFTLRRFNANLRIWSHQRRRQPGLQPPGYAYRLQPLLFEVGRNAVPIGPWTYRLTVLSEDQAIRHAKIKLRLRPGVKMNQVKTIQVQPNLNSIVTYHLITAAPPFGSGIAGLDLGIVNLAALAFQTGECILYSGQALLALGQQVHQQTSTLPKSSARSRSAWARVGHIRRLALHHLANSIIRECLARQVGTIVVGDLTHIRRNRRQQAVRMWAYARLVGLLTYKGLEVGIRVNKVDEAYTSKRCHWCQGPGWRTHRQRQFQCSVCGRKIDADVGAAFNILDKQSPFPVYAWGISPALDKNDDLPVIAPTHRADFTRAYTVQVTPVAAIDHFPSGNLLIRPSYPGQPNLAPGSKVAEKLRWLTGWPE